MPGPLDDGVLRVGIGIIAGFALHLILTTGFLNMVAAGTVAIKGTAGWKGALLVGFAAGFLERLVPDLLEKQQGSDSTQKSKTTDPNHVALANALTPPIAP